MTPSVGRRTALSRQITVTLVKTIMSRLLDYPKKELLGHEFSVLTLFNMHLTCLNTVSEVPFISITVYLGNDKPLYKQYFQSILEKSCIFE